MKNVLLAICFILAVLLCSDTYAQCSGGTCSRPVVRAGNAVRQVAVRPFRRGWFGRRNDRG